MGRRSKSSRSKAKAKKQSLEELELHSMSENESNEEEKIVETGGKEKGISERKEHEKKDDESEDENECTIETNPKGPLFSDENTAWLRPTKNKILDLDEDDGDDINEKELEVERQSRLIDMEMKAEKEEAKAEMSRTIAQETEIFHLPTMEELENEENRVVSPSEIRSRIESILEVLADFKSRREQDRSRSEYIHQLASDLSELYGYLPELMEYFLSMFGASETYEFVDASDRPRPLIIRTNTLKARRKDLATALMKRGVSLDPLANWSKVGLKIIESPVPMGATPEYLSGHYMLQSAASMCPVLALNPQPNEKVLDMSAAPGGKTSYLAQLMRNKGVIIANDLKLDRQKATVANMHRLGVKIVITCTHDGRKLGKKFPHTFDRILLDAPCSGLGVISRDPSVKVQRTIMDVKKNSHLQKELLLAAIDALNHKSKKSGGVMVYSTCSVSIFENEEVVNYALQKRDIKIISTTLDFGKPGFIRYKEKRFHPSLALTRRFYPHVHNMDGFFVAKIQKLSDGKTKHSLESTKHIEQDIEEKMKDSKEKDRKRKVDSSAGKETLKPNKNAKNDHFSIPPSFPKKKSNAKVTKPRRYKNSGS